MVVAHPQVALHPQEVDLGRVGRLVDGREDAEALATRALGEGVPLLGMEEALRQGGRGGVVPVLERSRPCLRCDLLRLGGRLARVDQLNHLLGFGVFCVAGSDKEVDRAVRLGYRLIAVGGDLGGIHVAAEQGRQLRSVAEAATQ